MQKRGESMPTRKVVENKNNKQRTNKNKPRQLMNTKKEEFNGETKVYALGGLGESVKICTVLNTMMKLL